MYSSILENTKSAFARHLILAGVAVAVSMTVGPAVRAADAVKPVIEGKAVPLLKNPGSLQWTKTIPELGDKSPEYSILYTDPKTNLTMLMFRTPVAVHIPAHTHDLAETHVILVGGTHTFDSEGVRYDVENGGFFRAPGGVVHEAWLPAGSQTLNILESDWVVNWLHGGPSRADINQYPPETPQGK